MRLASGTHSALNRYQREKIRDYLSGSASVSAPDTLRLIALQVQFADSLMGGQPGSRRVAIRDSTWFANELTHLRAYFRGASRGRMELTFKLDPVVVTLPRAMGYYGDDRYENTRVVVLARTLIDSVDARVDFSRYDHVFIIHAGAGQETDLAADSQGQIWSSFYDRTDINAAFPDTTLFGLATQDSAGGSPVRVDNFSIVPASPSQDFATVGSLGIWAFELASRIGLVPLFDSTPAGAPDSQGVGVFDLMASGLFNVNGFVPAFPSAFNRVLAGWLDPVVIDAQTVPQNVRLTDVNSQGTADTTCVRIPITGNEYYLVVNRVHDTNFDSLFTFGDVDSNLVPDNTDSLDGAEFDFFLTDLTNPFVRRFDPRYGFDVLFRYTGSGVYVWHIDEAVVRETLASGMLPDDFAEHKGVDLEEADGVQDLDRGGPAGFALGSHWDSFRSGDGNANRFGPDTNPDTRSNSGARTGIVLENISVPGPVMSMDIRRDAPYAEIRKHWAAGARGQPATAVDFLATPGLEIVMLVDTGGVYVFRPDGTVMGTDGNPATIDPYLVAPGQRWVGWPAFADLDGAGGAEIVATTRGGRVYAWKGDRTELADGDANPATQGVLYDAGRPIATPPVLVDLAGDSTPEILFFEDAGDTLVAHMIDRTGATVLPDDATLAARWPLRVAAQIAAPPVIVEQTGAVALRGVVLAALDTLSARVRVAYAPITSISGATVVTGDGWSDSIALPRGVRARDYTLSPPAAGDLDDDGDDEVVLTAPDGVVRIYEVNAVSPNAPRKSRLRSGALSAPALGDVDGNGTLEIAVWDSDYRYLLASNGRVLTNWPRPVHDTFGSTRPPARPARALASPVIADVDGNGRQEVIFPFDDGTLHAYDAAGDERATFPRPGPAVPSTPTVSALGTPGLSLVIAGALDELTGSNPVVDTVSVRASASLIVQSLPGGQAGAAMGWPMAGGDIARTGRAAPSGSTVAAKASTPVSTFMIYPNPVKDAIVHARVIINTHARISVCVYTLEGQEAFRHSWDADAGGAVNTPFDEPIDVSRLKSGVYFMRIGVDSGGGSTVLVKPFAIRR